MKIEDIFEVVWVEKYRKNEWQYPGVDVCLIPLRGKTCKDILAFYEKHGFLDYEKPVINKKLKDKRLRYVEVIICHGIETERITLDKKEGVFYFHIVGGHYITQHFSDILPKKEGNWNFRSIIGCDNKPVKFKTLEHGVLELYSSVIDDYFCGGRNDFNIGDVFFQRLKRRGGL